MSQYEVFVKGHDQEEKEAPLMLEINHDYMETKDNTSEGRIATSEIESIDEISSVFFILLKGGEAFIIPQKQVDYSTVKAELTELSEYLNVPYILNENWKWS